MSCPDDNTLIAYGQGALSPEEAEALELHADGCSTCQLLMAEAAIADSPSFDDPGQRLDAPASEGGELSESGRLGRYVLIGRVGAGAMGTVYAAYDPKLERKVALKLLHPSPSEAPEQLEARLVQEAQAMARLSHPNVVSVFDVGSWHGQVWLAMEFVEGQTLKQWMQTPRSLEERLGALVDAGRGLAAAHSAGLIHRDFKPDNVLVGPDGRARVTDFGLARAEVSEPSASFAALAPMLGDEDSTLASTQSGLVVGTPAYMAPDQLAGHPAEARSDQFSFCMVAWEVLSGERPLNMDQLRSLAVQRLTRERSARTGQPALELGGLRLSLGSPPAGMPPWVHRCLQRGLESDPERRFESMEALLEVLADDPRARRRQRWLLAGAVGGILLAVGALAFQRHEAARMRCQGSATMLAEVWSPERQSELRQAFASTGAAEAEAQATRVGYLLNAYAEDWRQMHQEACVATRVHGVQTEEGLGLRMACLERRRKELRSTVNLMLRPDAAMVGRGADMAVGLPDLSLCRDLEALRQPVPPPDASEARALLPALQSELADATALFHAGRYPEALARVRAIEPRARELGHRPTDAEVLFLEGTLELRLGDAEQAHRLMLEAIAAADAGRDDRRRSEIALRLGYAAAEAAQFQLSDTWLHLAEASIERLGGSTELEAVLASNRGSRLLRAGDLDGALAFYRRAESLAELHFGPDHHRTATMMSNVGAALLDVQQPAEAATTLARAVEILELTFGDRHMRLVTPLTILAHAQSQLSQHDDALESVSRAIAITQARMGAEHPRVAGLLDDLAHLHEAAGRRDEALETYRRSLALKRTQLEPGNVNLSYPLTGIGKILIARGEPAAAIPLLEEALAMRSALKLERAETALGLANAYWQAKRDHARAETLAVQAEQVFRVAGREDRAEASRALLSEVRAISSSE
jgi:tetratricopeptide (TPR) repeat protein